MQKIHKLLLFSFMSGCVQISLCDINQDLSEAVKEGDLEHVGNLLSQGANPNFKANSGDCSLLHQVAAGNLKGVSPEKNLSIAALLIHYKADVNDTDSLMRTPLHVALYEEMVAFLLENGANIEQKTANDVTPLWCAASDGRVSAFKKLLEAEADFTVPNKAGNTILHTAAAGTVFIFPQGEGVLDVFFDFLKPIKTREVITDFINSRNSLGETALYRAVRNGNIAEAKILIENGADPTIPTKSGSTTLHVVSAQKPIVCLDMIDLLFLFNISDENLLRQYKFPDVNASDNEGYTPMHAAVGYGNIAALWRLMRCEGFIGTNWPYVQTLVESLENIKPEDRLILKYMLAQMKFYPEQVRSITIESPMSKNRRPVFLRPLSKSLFDKALPELRSKAQAHVARLKTRAQERKRSARK